MKQSIKKELRYKSYTINNFRQIPQMEKLSEEQKFSIEVVGHVLPFRSNNYVVEELIDWENVPNDPIFILTFPQKEMLKPHHYQQMANVLKRGTNKQEIAETANRIRWELNPHPAGQLEHNIPTLNGQKLIGIQHKYQETVLFFPGQGQTCHAYCTFCFRWPQFVGINELKFALREANLLVEYVKAHPEVSDILITGGDPMILSAKRLAAYIDPILEANIPHLRNIRIGSKVLGYWPQKFVTDKDADETLALFERVNQAGKHLALMAHFNHPHELRTEIVEKAIQRIRQTGTQIRTQSPLLRNINDNPHTWASMWKKQVSLGLIPYYMFVARDTGAQHYFAIPLVQAWEIFKKAYQSVSGVCRTVRGPSMSAHPGKVQILGVGDMKDEKVLTLRFIQGRNPEWVHQPFFAKYNEEAIWLDDLEPAFDEKFFFEDELTQLYESKTSTGQISAASTWDEEDEMAMG